MWTVVTVERFDEWFLTMTIFGLISLAFFCQSFLTKRYQLMAPLLKPNASIVQFCWAQLIRT